MGEGGGGSWTYQLTGMCHFAGEDHTCKPAKCLKMQDHSSANLMKFWVITVQIKKMSFVLESLQTLSGTPRKRTFSRAEKFRTISEKEANNFAIFRKIIR